MEKEAGHLTHQYHGSGCRCCYNPITSTLVEYAKIYSLLHCNTVNIVLENNLINLCCIDLVLVASLQFIVVYKLNSRQCQYGHSTRAYSSFNFKLYCVFCCVVSLESFHFMKFYLVIGASQ